MSRKPAFDIQICKERLKQLANKMEDGVLVLPSNPEYVRNNDVFYEYRQDTNFYYFTAFEEPGSLFVFRPGKTPETILFVRKKDPLMETWDGFRFGPEGAKQYFGIDEAYEIEEAPEKLPELLKGFKNVYYALRNTQYYDETLQDALVHVRKAYGRGGKSLATIIDPSEIFGEMRLIKSEQELEWLRKACAITAEGHKAAREFVKPGVSERQVQGVLANTFMQQNSPRMGYIPIVASGASATTLHYNFNDQECKDGDLLLIDAGAEWNYFSGDITRTFPVNGKFTDVQKTVHDMVLNIQENILSMIKPGIEFKSLQDRTVELTIQALIELKVLSGTVEDHVKSQEYKKYYPHGVSHWLGMDVHDAGLYSIGDKSRTLEPHMCFTVEPGIYFPEHDNDVPKALRGIGVRIEDNVVVTADGHENLTS